MQDPIGHPVAWGKHVGVDPTTGSVSNDPLEPPSYPNSQETYFLYGNQRLISSGNRRQVEDRAESGPSTQGNNEQLGSATATSANQRTSGVPAESLDPIHERQWWIPSLGCAGLSVQCRR